jgi:hypothetical protein
MTDDVNALKEVAKEKIASILEACLSDLQHSAVLGENRTENVSPPLTFDQAREYLRKPRLMWTSHRNTSEATMEKQQVKLAHRNGGYYLQYGTQAVPFHEMEPPTRVRRLAQLPEDASHVIAGQSLVIKHEKCVIYITPDTEEALGADGKGALASAVLYMWAWVNQ